MKKILVPVDFSPKSEEALKVAANIAKMTGAEIHTIHLIDIPESEIDVTMGRYVPTGPVAIRMFEQTHEQFDEFLDKDFLNGITVYENVLVDNPVEGITEFAEKNDIDAIVIGSHGTTGLEDFFVGSNTEKVVRTSKIPVLVIKEPADKFKIEKVVYASKFTDENIPAFKKLMEFLKIFKPEIHLLRVNTISNFKSTAELEEIMNNFLKKVPEYDCFKKVLYDDYTVQEGIFNYSDRIGADLIALATHGRQGIMHFLSDSIAERIVNKAQKNILTIKMDK